MLGTNNTFLVTLAATIGAIMLHKALLVAVSIGNYGLKRLSLPVKTFNINHNLDMTLSDLPLSEDSKWLLTANDRLKQIIKALSRSERNCSISLGTSIYDRYQ